MPIGLLALFLKGMQHIYGITQLCHLNDSPFTQYMDAYLLNARAYRSHRPAILRLQPILNGAQFEACNSSRIFRKIPQLIQTRCDEPQLLDAHIGII